MAKRIGVISSEPPFHALPVAYTSKESEILWFNEIEAAFAFLLQDHVNRLIIDRALLDLAPAYTRKYHKLIEQLHPRLDTVFANFFDKQPTHHVERISYFPQLDTVFKNGDLRSVFQPIVDASGASPKIHGIECLSRFHYNGLFFAPEFIFNYAAEKLKLTNCDKICLMQALSLVPHDKNTLVFINVRPQTLISTDFCPWFKSLLKKHQLLPEQIVIEVTEQYCNISEQEMYNQCSALKNSGMRLAIDDFGSGISNLSMIEVMKPSYIKVSGRFIKNAHENSDKQKIIKNVLALANEFEITAIVESVEVKKEWELVNLLGARLAQGFYFFKPMAQEDLRMLLTQA